jgi:hypothetical protein
MMADRLRRLGVDVSGMAMIDAAAYFDPIEV